MDGIWAVSVVVICTGGCVIVGLGPWLMGYIDYMLRVIPVIPSSCTVMLISTEHFIAVVMLCCFVGYGWAEFILIKRTVFPQEVT